MPSDRVTHPTNRVCIRCGGSWKGAAFDPECEHEPEPIPIAVPWYSIKRRETIYVASLGGLRVEHPTREGAIAAWYEEHRIRVALEYLLLIEGVLAQLEAERLRERASAIRDDETKDPHTRPRLRAAQVVGTALAGSDANAETTEPRMGSPIDPACPFCDGTHGEAELCDGPLPSYAAEIEARGLPEWWDGAPPVWLRHSLAAELGSYQIVGSLRDWAIFAVGDQDGIREKIATCADSCITWDLDAVRRLDVRMVRATDPPVPGLDELRAFAQDERVDVQRAPDPAYGSVAYTGHDGLDYGLAGELRSVVVTLLQRARARVTGAVPAIEEG